MSEGGRAGCGDSGQRGTPLFAGYVGGGIFSPAGGPSGTPASAVQFVDGTTTYTYSYDFLGFTDPGTLKPVLKASSALTVADAGGIPSTITEVEVKGQMTFEDTMAVVNPGPKISLLFDLSSTQAADLGFDWARTTLSVFMSGFDINNNSQWSMERFFFITAPGTTSTTVTFDNLGGGPGIGSADIPANVVSIYMSVTLSAEIGYSNSLGESVAQSASASVDAMHTLVLQSITSLDQDGNPLGGVTFASSQGADYSEVPEPGNFLLVAGAAAAFSVIWLKWPKYRS